MSHRLPLDNIWSVLRLLCPDLGVCLVALVTVILCSRLVRNREMVAAANITSVSHFVLVCVCLKGGMAELGTVLTQCFIHEQSLFQTLHELSSRATFRDKKAS